MQVFKAMFKVIRKRMPSSLCYIIIFIIISIGISTAASKDNKFEASQMKVCVFDEDNTPESRSLIDFIGRSNKIVECENDMDTIIDSLYYSRVNYALIINKGYAERLAAGETAGLFGSYCLDESFSTVYIGQILDEYTASVKAYLAMGKTFGEAVAETEELLSLDSEVEMLGSEKGVESDFSTDFSMYFQYMPYILISVIMSVVCQVLVTMNRKDIRYRTSCSCLKNSRYIFQLFLASGLFVLGIWLLFMLVGMYMYEGMFEGRAWLAVLNSLIFSVVITALAVFVSCFEPKDNIQNLITQVLGLGMSFMCGIFIPVSVLSDGVLSAGRFMPAYWYIRANNMIADIQPYSTEEVIRCYLIQLAFAAMLIILSLLVRKIRYNGAAIGTGIKKAASA